MAEHENIAIRPYAPEDGRFLSTVAGRLHPGETVSPRDPVVLERFFAGLAEGKLFHEPGAEAFVATMGGRRWG